MLSKSVLFIALMLIVLLNVRSVSASPLLKEVLGDSINSSDLQMPPVTAGPGFLLPDNPLYFLDNFVQYIRLELASSTEQKALIHKNVALERLAELRIMLVKNNNNGITKALSGLSEENLAAARALNLAAAEGKKIQDLAIDLNNIMKLQKGILAVVTDQARGSLKLRLRAAVEDLIAAKIEVEDKLPEDMLNNEIQNTIQERIAQGFSDTGSTASDIEKSLNVLTRLSSEAAKKRQLNREEALTNIIGNKNTILQYENQIKQAERQKQLDQILKAKADAMEQAKVSIQQAQEAARKFEEANKEEKSLQEVAGSETRINLNNNF